jgi:hypothetical protein
MIDNNRWPTSFSRDYTWKELKTHDNMIIYCQLRFALSDFVGRRVHDRKEDHEPIIKAVYELQRMVDAWIGNRVAISVPGLLKQIKLFGLMTEAEIDDSDLPMIRSIRAGIEAITEGKRS